MSWIQISTSQMWDMMQWSVRNDAMVTLETVGNSGWAWDRVFTYQLASWGSFTASISLPDAIPALADWSRRVLGFRCRWCKWGACWRSCYCVSQSLLLLKPVAWVELKWIRVGEITEAEQVVRWRSSPQLRPPHSSASWADVGKCVGNSNVFLQESSFWSKHCIFNSDRKRDETIPPQSFSHRIWFDVCDM